MDQYIERLKADKRFWSDPEYRGNVMALMRLRNAMPDRSRLIVEEVLTLQEQQEALSAEFLLLNRV